jgi:bifunctional non-homologous end joining protein LigD
METKSPKPAGKAAKRDKEVTIGGTKLKLTNLDKVYFPADGITKGEIIDYYLRMSKYILPYLKDRPQSLNRHINGIAKPGFYQKDMDTEQIPEWLRTEKMYSKSNKEYLDYLICNDKATLIYMANLGCIEINPWHSTYDNPEFPDYLIMDLDPGEIGFIHVVETANTIKQLCDEIGIKCFCKTSGATGLHIYIPLKKQYDYNEVKIFAELLATATHKRLPETTSIERAVAKRRDKIYVDFLQNRKGQTIASVYSARPKPGATVSTPLLWEEVNADLDPKNYTIYNIEERLAATGDLWKGVLRKGADISKVLKKLEKLLV